MRPIDADFVVYAAECEFSEEDAAKIRWLISHIPTICAEPVRHGYWTFFKSIPGDEYTLKCSICNEWANQRHNYCPNCGAKMDKEG